jgi:hypothetical protein
MTAIETGAAEHPRLHFTQEGLRALRERAATSHHGHASRLIRWVEEHASWEAGVRGDSATSHGTEEVVLEEQEIFITNAALAAALSGEERYIEIATRWALTAARSTPAALDNYGAGSYAAGLARAYDWLFDAFSNSERGELRAAIAQICEDMYHSSFEDDPQATWWAGSHLHHDHWIATAGYGEAALGIVGEHLAAERWFERALSEFSECLSWLGDDGAWHEGAADWCYAMAALLRFFGAMRERGDEQLRASPWVRATATYRLYHRLPDDTYIYINDSFRSGRYNTSGSASCHLLRRLAALFDDRHAQWLAEQDEVFDLRAGPKGVFEAAYEGSSIGCERPEYPHTDAVCLAWNLLWFDARVPATPPTGLSPSRHFSNQGLAVLRSDWADAATICTLSCGPLAGDRAHVRMAQGEGRKRSNFSHCHVDYNAFTLFARGAYVVVPSGYARRDSGFQNTVSVNGSHFLPFPTSAPRLCDFTSAGSYSYAAGEATSGFAEYLGVTRFRRRIVLVRDMVVMFDDVELSGLETRSWNRFEWSMHTDPATHEVETSMNGAEVRALREGVAGMRLTVLEPSAFAWERATLTSCGGRALLEKLAIAVPEWYTRSMALVVTIQGWAGA